MLRLPYLVLASGSEYVEFFNEETIEWDNRTTFNLLGLCDNAPSYKVHMDPKSKFTEEPFQGLVKHFQKLLVTPSENSLTLNIFRKGGYDDLYNLQENEKYWIKQLLFTSFALGQVLFLFLQLYPALAHGELALTKYLCACFFSDSLFAGARQTLSID